MNAVEAQHQKSLLSMINFFKKKEDSGDDVNGGCLSQDLVLAMRREEIDWVHSEDVFESVPMQECENAKHEPLDLIMVDRQVCESDTQENSMEVVCKRTQNEEAK